jgi:hypothetical protein
VNYQFFLLHHFPTSVVLVKKNGFLVIPREYPAIRVKFFNQVLVKNKTLNFQLGWQGGGGQVVQVSPDKRGN